MSAFENPDGLAVARELIPAKVRKAIYAAVSLAGYGLSAVAVGMVAAGAAVPEAVPTALAVLGALTGPLGQLAASNTPSPATVAAVVTEVADDPAEGVGDDALTEAGQ